MAERKAVTNQMAKRYRRATKSEKGVMLDELCALTGWTRRHARRALTDVLKGKPAPPPRPRPRVYGPEVLEPLKFIWATLNGPAGKRLAPFMPEIIETLERHGELQVPEDVRAKLLKLPIRTFTDWGHTHQVEGLAEVPRAGTPVVSD
jgi:hypothetical protein